MLEDQGMPCDATHKWTGITFGARNHCDAEKLLFKELTVLCGTAMFFSVKKEHLNA